MIDSNKVKQYKDMIVSSLTERPMATVEKLNELIQLEVGFQEFDHAAYHQAICEMIVNNEIKHTSYFSLRVRDQEAVFKAWNEHSTFEDASTIFKPMENTDGRFMNKYAIPPSISVTNVYDEIIQMIQEAAGRNIFESNRVQAYFQDQTLNEFLVKYAEHYDAPVPIVGYSVYSKTIKEFATELADCTQESQTRNRNYRKPSKEDLT